MINRDIDLFANILKERQEALICELEQEALLSDGPRTGGLKRKLLLSVLAVIAVTVVVAAGAQLLM